MAGVCWWVVPIWETRIVRTKESVFGRVCLFVEKNTKPYPTPSNTWKPVRCTRCTWSSMVSGRRRAAQHSCNIWTLVTQRTVIGDPCYQKTAHVSTLAKFPHRITHNVFFYNRIPRAVPHHATPHHAPQHRPTYCPTYCPTPSNSQRHPCIALMRARHSVRRALVWRSSLAHA